MSEYVWYACYGSNLSESRFKLYIDNCRDKTFPCESRAYLFSHPVYFGEESQKWQHCGTAFLDTDRPGYALGRIYKITKDQYIQIKDKEGPKYSRPIDDLEPIDDIPVFSFTSETKNPENAPSYQYYRTILTGMLETYPYLDESSLGYFLARSILPDQDFSVLEAIRKAQHGISAFEVSERCAIGIDAAVSSIRNLIQIKLLCQDRRTLQFSLESPDARFYTDPNAHSEKRKLIDDMIRCKHSAAVLDPYNHLDSPSPEDECTQVILPNNAENDSEGRRILYYTNRYERSPRNRENAIRQHGTTCQVCGFNFEDVYGDIGRGFIEVHHVVPLSSKDAVTSVNPSTDLVCLCANCHRMIHKAPNGVYSVEELKSILRNQ